MHWETNTDKKVNKSRDDVLGEQKEGKINRLVVVRHCEISLQQDATLEMIESASREHLV